MKRTDEFDALLTGRHHDPHSILGAHLGTGETTIIRALRPGAVEVRVHTASHTATLIRRDGALFEVSLPENSPLPLTYEIETAYPSGTTVVSADPYAFPPTVDELDLYLYSEGRNDRLGEIFGARSYTFGETSGTAFTVWAPSARAVSLVGDFNSWNDHVHPMRSLGSSGIWELFLPGLAADSVYKYSVLAQNGDRRLKADPLARATEVPPRTASITWNPHYHWRDDDWLAARENAESFRQPVSIYELHLGSWRKGLPYDELAVQISDYVSDLGFTHVELMPVMEHPFNGSWGYQVTGFFAPTSRFGTPDEFRAFIDTLHGRGIGVLLDWVPAHFPRDEWALARFDGTALYEHEDARRGAHPDWGTLIFNHGRNEVRNFLIASANTWLGNYHCDGLRVDAVASMLYLDYSRQPGEWIPNRFGGRENLEAIEFLKELNTIVHRDHKGTMMIAEESTAWPGVSRPVSEGGLGFGFKWNMGWMHDTLEYFAQDPIYRKYHHHELTFSALYAFSEHFVLPLSHDEVVHGKGSLFTKMPGDVWQKLANLRALYGYMWAHPGKKLLFMGGEFAQEREWNHEQSIDWHHLDDPAHRSVQDLIRDLNHYYRDEAALWELDGSSDGFSWLEANDADDNVLAFVRRGTQTSDQLVCVCNFSPVPRYGFRLGVPLPGPWRELLNTDSSFYGGSNIGNDGGVNADVQPSHGWPQSVKLNLPPLGTLWLTPEVRDTY